MVGRFHPGGGRRYSRGFPTDLPMVGLLGQFAIQGRRRGFPTDLPMVGRSRK